jgi:hypothetical protein
MQSSPESPLSVAAGKPESSMIVQYGRLRFTPGIISYILPAEQGQAVPLSI